MCTFVKKILLCKLGMVFASDRLFLSDVNDKYVSNTFLNFSTLVRLVLPYFDVTEWLESLPLLFFFVGNEGFAQMNAVKEIQVTILFTSCTIVFFVYFFSLKDKWTKFLTVLYYVIQVKKKT